MIKLDITGSDDITPYPQVSVQAALHHSDSTRGDVLADLENLWGENRDCFESILNPNVISDCESCEDYNISRLPSKPLISKLAPIGETFSRNINMESSVSSTLSMISNCQFLQTDEANFTSSPTKPNFNDGSSEILFSEYSASQRCSCTDEKSAEPSSPTESSFPLLQTKVQTPDASPEVPGAEQNFEPINFSQKNRFISGNFLADNKHLNLGSFSSREYRSDIKQQMMLGGLITPPVSPEEESCGTSPVNFASSRINPTLNQFPNLPESQHLQRPLYPTNVSLASYEHSIPVNQSTAYIQNSSNQISLECKVKTEPSLFLEENSSHFQPQASTVRTIPPCTDHAVFHTNGFQHHLHLHQHHHHNWKNDEKTNMTMNQLFDGRSPEIFGIQKVRIRIHL